MSKASEHRTPTPVEEKVRAAFQSSVPSLVEHLNNLGNPHFDRFGLFMEGVTGNGTVILWGTKRYNQDMERAGRNAMKRPFGIEIDTLSPSIQVVLYPAMVYKPYDELRTIAKEEGYEVREEGVQTMVYFLDEFEKEAGNTHDLAANLLFISHMIDAALKGRYPLEQGERSAEFLEEVRDGLSHVREYIVALTLEQRASLSPRIARISLLDDEELAHEAQRRVSYDIEPMKMPGLYEPARTDVPQKTPQDAIKNRTFYLHLDQRNLPPRIKDKKTIDVPSLPWIEYGKNRWNRSHELFGRYELRIGDQILLVDFRLDSTHMPAKYGFFDTIEITQHGHEGISQHIVLGQEVAGFFEVFPVIVAGEFDFSHSETQRFLQILSQDKGTKPEVAKVLTDVLNLSAKGTLQRVNQLEENQ